MRRIVGASLLICILSGCGVVRKKTTYASPPPAVTVSAGESEPVSPGVEESEAAPAPLSEADRQAAAVVRTALTFTGTRYRFGGTTSKGMDCSGLLYTAFQEHDFSLPRVSHQMADQGRRVRVEQLRKGDLLFFKTTRRGGKINHVGLVVEIAGDDVRFIHSTSSRGVIVSSLREGFWNYAFVKATRIF